MKKLTIILALVLFAHTGVALAAQDPNQPDTLKVDSVGAFTTGSATVPVRFFNDETLSGLEVVLKFASPDVALDSFSFVNGRLETNQFKGFTFNGDSTIITIFAFDEIAVGTGILGDLYFSWSPLITPLTVTIDTASFSVGQIDHTTSFSDTGYTEFIPIVKKGYVDIKAEPAELDSIWLEDVDVVAGESMALDVNFFNEEPVQEFRLALDYATSDFHYDSVSLNGLRLIPSPVNSPIVQNQNSTHEMLVRLTFPDGNPLPVGSGPMVRLYFTVAPVTPEQTYPIDTTMFAGLIGTLITRPADFGGKVFVPFFTPGSVTVKVATDVHDVDTESLPTSFDLAQNYPNPFNPSTHIRFSLPEAGKVRIDVYNVLGQTVRTLVDQYLSAGVHEVVFDSRNGDGETLASGVYFYRMSHPEFVETRKMILLK